MGCGEAREEGTGRGKVIVVRAGIAVRAEIAVKAAVREATGTEAARGSGTDHPPVSVTGPYRGENLLFARTVSP